jgi:hypothetical protein
VSHRGSCQRETQADGTYATEAGTEQDVKKTKAKKRAGVKLDVSKLIVSGYSSGAQVTPSELAVHP